MNKAVIFDLDGTILDTLPDIMDNLNLMLCHYGYPLVDIAKTRKYIGCGARSLVERAIGIELTSNELDERLAYYNKFYTESNSPKTKLFDGIREVILELKNRGFKLAILTNKPQETTNTVYREYLSDFGFDKVVGQSGKVKCKPDKTATLEILKELNVSAENTYFVGDGETDVKTALNSNTKSVAVLWGYRDKDELFEAGARVFAKTPQDLLSILV